LPGGVKNDAPDHWVRGGMTPKRRQPQGASHL